MREKNVPFGAVIVCEKENISVEVLQLGPLNTNCGIISDGERCVLIDASPDSVPTVDAYISAKKLLPIALCLTHKHWDHCTDAHVWNERGVRTYAHELDANDIAHPDDILAQYELDIPACPVDVILQDGQKLDLLDRSWRVLWLPGHTEGGAGYYLPEIGICFSGDTLFAGTVGRSDFHGGDKHALFRSIREKLYTLPDDTIIVPGHGKITTIGNEKGHNLFIRPNRERFRGR